MATADVLNYICFRVKCLYKISIEELTGFDECWNDWLACDNEYAIQDRKTMEAGAGKYMNLLAIALRRM